jgi:hypothetical protein
LYSTLIKFIDLLSSLYSSKIMGLII